MNGRSYRSVTRICKRKTGFGRCPRLLWRVPSKRFLQPIRGLWNLSTPDYVIQVFQHLFACLSYLSRQVALIYIYIHSEIYPKGKIVLGQCPLDVSILLILIRHSVVMPRTGLIICLSIHLPFYSWKYQSEQTITNSIVVQICFFLVEYLKTNKIKYFTRRICGGDGFGVLRAKRSAIFP